MRVALVSSCALATAVASVSAAVLSVAWWASPEFFAAGLVPVLFADVILAIIGIGVLLEMNEGRRVSARTISAAWRAVPRWLGFVLVTCGVVSGVCGLIALSATSYTQNSAGTQSGCRWSIGTNHGETNLCVTHARWLATGEENQRGGVGLAGVFLVVEAVVFVGAARRGGRVTVALI